MQIAGKFFLWALVAISELLLITLPVGAQAQFIAGIGIVALMALIKVRSAQGPWRLIFLALGSVVVLRYVYWRTTETLPPIQDLEDFIPGFLLYLAEMYNVLMLALSLFIVATPLPARPSLLASEVFPTVDVFIPSYNEDLKLLANTVAASSHDSP